MYDGQEIGTPIILSLYLIPWRVSMKIFMATKFPSKTEVSIVACLLENHLSRAVFEMMKTFNETSLFFLLIGGYQHNHVLKLPFPFPQRR